MDMFCPYCAHPNTEVTNSRLTKKNSQVWRRRKCTQCKSIFTTHEIIDLSHLLVIKKSGKAQKFSRAKLYSGIYGATISSKVPNREYIVDKITRDVEAKLLALKTKETRSEVITDIILSTLKKNHAATFLRYLAYAKNIQTEAQMKREFKKYA
jgi:transcriptional repressor NrdR